MAASSFYSDPFNIEELLKQTKRDIGQEESWTAFQWDELAQKASIPLDVPASKTLPSLRSEFINLNDLDAELPGLDDSDISSTSSALEQLHTPAPEIQTDIQERSVWELISADVTSSKQTQLTSWDTFSDPSSKPLKSPYLSEQSDKIFAAALRRFLGQKSITCTLRPGVLLPALSQLGLGRPSRLFKIDGSTGMVTSTLEQFEELGISSVLLEQMIGNFRRWALHWWKLRQFQREQVLHTPSQKTLSAFVYALTDALHGVETRIVGLSSSCGSLLQLHECYQCIEPLLQVLVRLVDSVSSRESFLSNLVQETEAIVSIENWTYQILREILRLCAVPSLVSLATSVGLSSAIGTFGNPKDKPETKALKSLLPTDLLHMVVKCEDSLHFLKKYEPSHPLLLPRGLGKRNPDLRWETSWKAIEGTRLRALEYEEELRAALHEYQRRDVFVNDFTKAASHRSKHPVVEDRKADSCLANLNWDDNNASPISSSPSICQSHLFELASSVPAPPVTLEHDQQPFDPPLLISLATSIQPLLSAQSALVNSACLDMILHHHDLMKHINLCKRFYLMDDETYRTRLTETLFETSRPYANIYIPNHDVLSPEFSFGIDDPPTETGSGSPDVVDLLRLYYRPPPVLTPVISDHALHLYDRIFKSLLRLLRLLHLTRARLRESTRHPALSSNSKPREPPNQRFLIATHAFVHSLADYIYTTGINQPWTKLEDTLRRAKQSLEYSAGHESSDAGAEHSLDSLRSAHEDALSTVCERLFLGAKQKKVRKKLERVFDAVGGAERDWAGWKEHVRAFVGEMEAVDGQGAEELLLRVDFGGFYR